MQEYVSQAVVLHAEPKGEADHRVSLFTKRFGKISAKAKSTRKITSKLAAHLQPGNVIEARIVYVGGHQVVDALKSSRLPIDPNALYQLNRLLAEQEREGELWTHLTEDEFSWKNVLRLLGWDPAHGACRVCHRSPELFRLRDQEFYCRKCAFKGRPDEVIYI
jgi:recombinational DNA repair protein (RecF pathway)